MPSRIYLWLPSLTVFALSACGGSEAGFFGGVGTAGTGNSNNAGASSSGGSTSSSGSPGSAGNPGGAGRHEAGASSGGAPTAGANSGGANSGGTSSGGTSSGGTSSGGTSSGGTSSGGTSSGGGVTGRAGAGAGGNGASAGHAGGKGGASNGGSAGVGGTNQGLSCAELLKQANQQLEAARECNLAVDALQCTGKVTNQCGCQIPVQRTDSTETKAYLKTLKLLEDKNCAIACTAIACELVTDAQCKSSSTSAMGTCVATNHGPGP